MLHRTHDAPIGQQPGVAREQQMPGIPLKPCRQLPPLQHWEQPAERSSRPCSPVMGSGACEKSSSTWAALTARSRALKRSTATCVMSFDFSRAVNLPRTTMRACGYVHSAPTVHEPATRAHTVWVRSGKGDAGRSLPPPASLPRHRECCVLCLPGSWVWWGAPWWRLVTNVQTYGFTDRTPIPPRPAARP